MKSASVILLVVAALNFFVTVTTNIAAMSSMSNDYPLRTGGTGPVMIAHLIIAALSASAIPFGLSAILYRLDILLERKA
ncbi:hypothetical protein ABDK56_00915 [Sphingomonas sp. ASV193]|uniref:hypothetical protein n=1 Tax=Sphingomonas sp. ASV193 TaxID=3144405 RepID=UPI0032E887E7